MLCKKLNLLLLVCFAAASLGCMEKPVSQATEELFVPLPAGLPPTCCNAVREALEDYIEAAPIGTSMTFFMADNQGLTGSMTIPAGSPAYRRKIAKQRLAAVFDRLDPEKSNGSQAVDLISLSSSVRKYRKSDLKPRVVVIGSPMVVDREQGADITGERIPCDGCVTDSKSSYGRMANFPNGTTVSWLLPRQDYGNGPNHRGQVEHFLRYLLKVKGGPLVCMSSDAQVVFNATECQWDEEVTPLDNCTGLKAVADDEAKPTLYDADGKTAVLKLTPTLAIKVRPPDEKVLKGDRTRVLFLPDISGSVAWDANGNPRTEVFEAIKSDLCEKLDKMQFTQFAICGFGGGKNLKPRLSKYPNSVFTGLYWADATRENRDQAIEFVRQLQAGGGTPTRTALQEAVNLEGTTMVILYSDGIPTLGDGGQEAVLTFAKELAEKHITVNTVGVGSLSAQNENFDWSGGEFLARLAKLTSGEYFALESDSK